MDRNIIIIIAIIIVGTLLAGCGTQTTNFTKYTGTDGLLISFAKNAPPTTIYEAQPFPVRFTLHDAGAYNISYDKIMITFSTDPLYIKQSDSGLNPLVDLHNLNLDKTEIVGRSLSYMTGESQDFTIPTDNAFQTNPIMGQRAAPQTQLTASVCYAYMTTLSTNVCIDTNLYGQNQRPQVCQAQDLTFTGGQGAPIAVTQIEVASLPVINPTDNTQTIRPQFIIHIENVGQGYLIGPDNLPFATACLLKSIPSDSIGGVLVQASLLGTPLQCGQSIGGQSSGIVQLIDNKGQVTCTVPAEQLNSDIYSATQNFQTTLSVNITYLYKVSTTADITIQRLGQGAAPSLLPTQGGSAGKTSGYAYDESNQLRRDASGNPMTLCDYYAQHPDQAPAPISSQINGAFACACSSDRCLTLNHAGSSGKCLLSPLCPGDSFCCTDIPGSTTPPSTSGGTSPTGDTTPATGASGAPAGDGLITPTGGPSGTVSTGDTLTVSAGASANVANTVANINIYKLYPLIKTSAAQYGITEASLLSIFTIESQGKVAAQNNGAVGIAQFRGPAAYDMGLCDNTQCTGADWRMDPQKAVPAAARYLAQQYSSVKSYVSTEHDQMSLMAAAYNQGAGCIHSAYTKAQSDLPQQTLTAGAILSRVPTVCGSGSSSVIQYVQNFWKYYQEYGTPP